MTFDNNANDDGQLYNCDQLNYQCVLLKKTNSNFVRHQLSMDEEIIMQSAVESAMIKS